MRLHGTPGIMGDIEAILDTKSETMEMCDLKEHIFASLLAEFTGETFQMLELIDAPFAFTQALLSSLITSLQQGFLV
ncbi:hypothetical protein M422DRAFT_276996 [Sphaerobolus stellatus SS14]|uniref:Uncharacterized protein n=1 Tax=Sphaerobolus stellatus (strain SS14) TaxID=990650 RepID=A0A0C9TL07_SPHS4|nr:hypothetical protein M422DRAFT_276996 [Sphaerobolus stellatus SS14]